MNNNPECPPCPTGDNENLCFFAGRVEKVYVSDAFDSSPDENRVLAEDAIRAGTITPDDIGRLTTEIESDINFSLTGCFVQLHQRAQTDRNTLAGLTDEQKVAVAGCATHRLRRTCQL